MVFPLNLSIHLWGTGTLHFHNCLIHYSAGQTSPVKWALFRLTAIAAPGLVAVLPLCPTYKGLDVEYVESRKAKDPVAKRNRLRRITWFNPQYSKKVKTRVGHEFVKLFDKNFPAGSSLHSVQ